MPATGRELGAQQYRPKPNQRGRVFFSASAAPKRREAKGALELGAPSHELSSAIVAPQNKKYRCAIGSLSAGSQTRSSPSALTS